MALCRLSFLFLPKSTIYLVFYYRENSTATGIVEYLIPRMELMGRLPRYMESGPLHRVSDFILSCPRVLTFPHFSASFLSGYHHLSSDPLPP